MQQLLRELNLEKEPEPINMENKLFPPLANVNQVYTESLPHLKQNDSYQKDKQHFLVLCWQQGYPALLIFLEVSWHQEQPGFPTSGTTVQDLVPGPLLTRSLQVYQAAANCILSSEHHFPPTNLVTCSETSQQLGLPGTTKWLKASTRI